MERTGLVLVLVVGILSTSAFGFELPGKQLVSKILDKASNLVGKQNQDDFSLRLPQRAIPLGDWDVPFDCPRDGLYGYPDDCTKGVSCFGGKSLAFTCTDLLHFNNFTKQCDDNFCSARCDPSLACECGWDTCETSEFTTEETEIDDVLANNVRTSFKCTEDGFYRYPFDCNRYVRCSNGIAYIMACPSGLHFSMKTKRCERPEDAECDSKPSYEEECVSGPVTGPCRGHFQRFYYDVKSRQCLEFVYGGCGGNGNNYKTIEECRNRCEAKTLTSLKMPPSEDYENDEGDVNWPMPFFRSSCSQDGLFAHPDNCYMYFECFRGRRVLHTCRPGLHFNKKTKLCDTPCKAKCDPKLSCARQRTESLISERSMAESFSSSNLLKSPKNVYKLKVTFVCSEDGLFPHRNDCNKYINCSNGNAYEMSCPPSRHFNKETQLCEAPCSARCDADLICDWQDSMIKLEEAYVDICNNTDESYSEKSPYNCEIYYKCEGAVLNKFRCPNGRHFYRKTSRCEEPCKAHCDPRLADKCGWRSVSVLDESKESDIDSAPKELLGDFDCQTDGYHVNPLDCGSFIQCFRGDAYVISCPPDLHYNPTLEICMSPCEAKCAPNYEEFCRAEELNGRNLQRSQSFPAKQPFPLVSQFICSHDGVYPNPEDCSSYIECVMGEGFEKDCPEVLHFSEETQTCESPCDARCDSSLGQSCGWNDIWAAAEGTRKADLDFKMFSDANSPRLMYHFTCMKDGLYKNPENCSSYIQCSGGHSYVMPCPPGLHFNEKLKVCDYPCSAHCDEDLACQCEWDTCGETGGDTCEENEQFSECGTACPPTCKDREPEVCTDNCVRGCFCKSGYIREWARGKCIPVAKCRSDSGPKELLGDFDCQTDGYRVNPLDCGSFIECFRGDAYVISCPQDLHYSPTLKTCMSLCEAKCAPNYEQFCRAEEFAIFQKRCFEDLGCFYTGRPFYHPLHRPISVLPSQNLSTQFLLYTPKNPNDPQVLLPTNESLRTSTLDPNLETKILIHGFTVRLDPGDICFKMKDELLNHNPMNVIIVNWTKDNQQPYYRAVANARVVGAQVAKLINYHVKNMNMDPKTVHVIGHSLGAQMSGWVGERVPGLGRITGLDPAGPWFQKAPPEVRLDATDAEFVDIIHTNGGDIFIKGYGLNEPIGHLDFYPNGGNGQPGCFYAALTLTRDEPNRITNYIANSCDHSRANYFFLHSINKCQFVSVQCTNYTDFREGKCKPENSSIAVMGYHATKLDSPTEGTSFYLRTTEQTPFCGESNEIV